MKHAKAPGLAAVLAVVASLAFAGMASASDFLFKGSVYTGTISAESGKIELFTSTLLPVVCSKSTFEAKVEKDGFFFDAGGKINSLVFSGCSHPVTVLAKGSFDVDALGGGKGDFQLFGTEITVHHEFGINCLFKAASGGTDIGTFTGNNSTSAIIDLEGEKEIPRTGDSAFCGPSGEFEGSYTVTTPSPLTVT